MSSPPVLGPELPAAPFPQLVAATEPAPAPPVPIIAPEVRTWTERVLQVVLFEVSALLIAVPLYSRLIGVGTRESTRVLIVVSVAVLLWASLHNFVFDRCESRLRLRSASDRTVKLRILHAVSHEASAALVSVPILVLLGDLPWLTALWADIGLSVVYAAFAFVFYAAYDRVRPVRQPIRRF